MEILVREHNQLVITDDYGTVQTEKWERELAYFVNTKISSSALDEADIIRIVRTEVAANLHHFASKNKYKVSLTPFEYEHFCAKELQKAGWETTVTPGSGDQGAEIVAKKNDTRMIVQCKKHSRPIGNRAVQEAIAAREYFDANIAVVATNSTFTTAAKQLATKSGVVLTHHDDLSGVST
ncbi:restriction endonuclease [bacterium]|nr:restriction endonuclease [bacterium]